MAQSKKIDATEKAQRSRSWISKISNDHKVTIPADILRTFDLQQGDKVEIIRSDGSFTLIPMNKRPRAYGRIFKLAVRVFADDNSATLWLNEPQFGLDGAIPAQHMRTASGAKDVEDLLGRIAHGVMV